MGSNTQNDRPLFHLPQSLERLILISFQKNSQKDFLHFISNEQKQLESRRHLFIPATSSYSYQEFYVLFATAQLHLVEKFKESPYSGLAISMLNHPETLAWILAALTLRITTTLLDPRDSDEHQQKKLSRTIGQQYLINTSTSRTIFLDKFNQPSQNIFDENFSLNSLHTQDKNQPLIQVFTSGSTGFSKIVPLSEKNILANIDALVEHHKLDTKLAIGTSLPVYHVNCLFFSFLASFLSGSELYLFDRFDLSIVKQLVSHNLIDIFSTIPEQLRLIEMSKHNLQLSQRFRYFLTAAAPLSQQLATKLNSAFPGKIRQGYGLSEAVNFSATMPANLNETEQNFWLTHYQVPSIGTALLHNEILICDDNRQVLSNNQIGNVLIKGSNVMSGYLGEEQAQLKNTDWLETGDLGFFDYSSNQEKFYFIVGRKKDTAKRYGESLPLAEIDAYLTECVDQNISIIAVHFEHEPSGENIAALVQINNKIAKPDFEVLKEKIEKLLPELYRPTLIGWTTSAIRTSSGKPKRWNFRHSFLGHKEKILFGKIHIIQEEITPVTHSGQN